MDIEELKKQTPSERLQFALDALEEMEKSDLYRVDMGTYHTYSDGVCFACLGGAAAIKAINGGFNTVVRWQTTDNAAHSSDDWSFTKNLEYSLDYARQGQLSDYLEYFERPLSWYIIDDFDVEEYRIDPSRFKQDIREMIAYLKNKGL